ncbi:VOC family protein [bacterium]|nr:MAG: VOC family protein [bacterium]
MITRLNHVSILVLDHDVAYDFYVNKLGFEVRTDATFGEGNRWLTVGPKSQPDLEIVLALPEMTMKPEVAAQIRELIAAGTFGCGVFESSDIHKDYEELTAKGVQFKGPPEEQFYGIEALMTDPFGNWFSVTQRK